MQQDEDFISRDNKKVLDNIGSILGVLIAGVISFLPLYYFVLR